MKIPKLVIFASGSGSNLQAINDAINNNIIVARIVKVILNKNNKTAIGRCLKHNLDYEVFLRGGEREEYNKFLAEKTKEYSPDILILAGWDYIFSNAFLIHFPNIINLHPALPGTFVGWKCVEKAYNAFKKGEIEYTGVMCHNVIEDVDCGTVLSKCKVPIFNKDTLLDLQLRVHKLEKGVLLEGLQKMINLYYEKYDTVQKAGKTKDSINLKNNKLAFIFTDRQSAFDKYICDIPNKGKYSCQLNSWWMKHTEDIIG